jgi:hypothetical protein
MNTKIKFFLVIILVMALSMGVTGAASAVSGAISTTHNPGFVDDNGYIDQACLNGNGVNCNLYLDKRDVWFSGLPVSASLGSGKYFFVVLVPGGQRNPNDGAPKNLSDDFDAYTNRTFSVGGNGIITAYSGTHHRDGNLLQLFPYADTTNNGGVYTLAVCSLDGKLKPAKFGKPGVSPSDCKFDAFKIKKSTPPICQPADVTAVFSQVAVGSSIEGMGVVAPNLNIDAKGTAVTISAGLLPALYEDNSGVMNGGVPSGGGFSDKTTQQAHQAHQYTFTFAAGTSVSRFSLQMLDFGDFNPSLDTSHYVSMIAYNTNGTEVSTQEISYTTPGVSNPSSSNLYGNLLITGDATASPGQPGNWTWDVSGTGIVKIVLDFGAGFDPNIGFDTLTFTTACQ